MIRQLGLFFTILLTLSACQSTQQTSDKTLAYVKKTQHVRYQPTLPTVVALNKSSNKKYEELGTVKINRYNLVGIKRQRGTINDLLKKNAAKIGGHAVIGVHSDHEYVMGQVIRYSV